MGEQNFRLSDDYSALMETGQGAQVVRLIEELGRRSDAGEDMGTLMKDFMASAATQVVDNNIKLLLYATPTKMPMH